MHVAFLKDSSQVGDGPSVLKGGRRLSEGCKYVTAWHRKGRQVGVGWLLCTSPPASHRDHVIYQSALHQTADNSLPESRKEKERVLKIQALPLAFVSCPCQSPFVRSCALQAVTSHGWAPMALLLPHNNLHSRWKTEPFFLPISSFSSFQINASLLSQHLYSKNSYNQMNVLAL